MKTSTKQTRAELNCAGGWASSRLRRLRRATSRGRGRPSSCGRRGCPTLGRRPSSCRSGCASTSVRTRRASAGPTAQKAAGAAAAAGGRQRPGRRRGPTGRRGGSGVRAAAARLRHAPATLQERLGVVRRTAHRYKPSCCSRARRGFGQGCVVPAPRGGELRCGPARRGPTPPPRSGPKAEAGP